MARPAPMPPRSASDCGSTIPVPTIWPRRRHEGAGHREPTGPRGRPGDSRHGRDHGRNGIGAVVPSVGKNRRARPRPQPPTRVPLSSAMTAAFYLYIDQVMYRRGRGRRFHVCFNAMRSECWRHLHSDRFPLRSFIRSLFHLMTAIGSVFEECGDGIARDPVAHFPNWLTLHTTFRDCLMRLAEIDRSTAARCQHYWPIESPPVGTTTFVQRRIDRRSVSGPHPEYRPARRQIMDVPSTGVRRHFPQFRA